MPSNGRQRRDRLTAVQAPCTVYHPELSLQVDSETVSVLHCNRSVRLTLQPHGRTQIVYAGDRNRVIGVGVCTHVMVHAPHDPPPYAMDTTMCQMARAVAGGLEAEEALTMLPWARICHPMFSRGPTGVADLPGVTATVYNRLFACQRYVMCDVCGRVTNSITTAIRMCGIDGMCEAGLVPAVIPRARVADDACSGRPWRLETLPLHLRDMLASRMGVTRDPTARAGVCVAVTRADSPDVLTLFLTAEFSAVRACTDRERVQLLMLARDRRVWVRTEDESWYAHLFIPGMRAYFADFYSTTLDPPSV